MSKNSVASVSKGKSAKHFSRYIKRMVKYPSYCKINIKRKRVVKYKDLYNNIKT